MRHKVLPAATTLLWTINAVYVLAIGVWPALDAYDSGQRLLLGSAIAVTGAWLWHRHGVEYRLGYRQGRQDQARQQQAEYEIMFR